jgi:hypothetical protein
MKTSRKPWQDAHIDYRGYCIRLKDDFGPEPTYVDGMPCLSGFIVTYGEGHPHAGANAMPAATWFQTVKAAKHATDVLIDVGGQENADEFWSMLRAETACRHLRYIVGPPIQTPQGPAPTHVCTQCGDWRVETHALTAWQPSVTLDLERNLAGSGERHLTAEITAH